MLGRVPLHLHSQESYPPLGDTSTYYLPIKDITITHLRVRSSFSVTFYHVVLPRRKILIALLEYCPLIPDTPPTSQQLISQFWKA